MIRVRVSAGASSDRITGVHGDALKIAVTLRRSPPLEPIYALAQKSEDRLVRMVYLLYCMTDLDDPMIDAAKRGDDADIRLVAETIEARVRKALEEQQQ